MKYWKFLAFSILCCTILFIVLPPLLSRPYRSNERYKPEKLVEIQIEKGLLRYRQEHDNFPTSLVGFFPEYVGSEIRINRTNYKAYYFKFSDEDQPEYWSLVVIYPSGQPGNFRLSYTPDGNIDVVDLVSSQD